MRRPAARRAAARALTITPVTGSSAYVAAPPPLIGRASVLDEVAALAESRPGAIVVAGEPGAGTTRVMREAAARLALDGAVVVAAERPGPGAERMAEALVAAGHGADPAWAARMRPMVVVLGDRPGEPELPGELARRLAGTRALVLIAAREMSPDAPTLVLGRLSPGESAELAARAAPGIDPLAVTQIALLGDGLPGRIIPLAVAARRWPGGDAPLPIPEGLAAWGRARIADLEPVPRDMAAWAAVVGTPTTPDDLARVCRHDPEGIARALDALVAAGVMEELPGPPRPHWIFRDRLVTAVLTADLGGMELRRRHAAALVAGRAAGADPEGLARHAVAAADGEATVTYGIRAAERARARGAFEAALSHAGRALAWWTPEIGESRRLAALHERGMALLEMSAWLDAAAALEEAAAGRRELHEHEPALASISAASSARWLLGQHDAALHAMQDHLGHGTGAEAPPSRARGEALAQAAGMAVMTSRFSEAMALAGDARAEAAGAGDPEVSARALIFLGMAESGLGGPGGLLHLARARREGAQGEGPGQRNETLAMIHESHVLLALGRPDEAAACARAGATRAAELGIVDHELVLAGNLGEALAAAGELAEARSELERAVAGWAQLGREAPSPADPGVAWLLFAEGRLDDALVRYRGLAEVMAEEAVLFEQLAPVAAGHALAAVEAGELAEAAGALAGALAAWEATDDRLTSIPLLAAAAEAGPADQAERSAAALAGMAGAGAPLASPFAAYVEGHLAQRAGSTGVAAASLRRAAAGFDATGMRWWAARALFGAGVIDGPTERGAEDLLAARRAFRDMGAGGWRRRAEARLRAIGRRIPTRSPRPSTPGAGLSAREREVLDQLALGLRNRDIGERLFISERTVARHLAQIYAKLGVSTRTAAVHAGRELGLLSADVR